MTPHVMRRAALLALVAVSMAVSRLGAAQTVLEAPGPQGPLAGTISAAGLPHAPVILIIPGSGPVDRDGNSFPNLRSSTYRLLADGLAARGITTIRIDKRGLFGSRAAVADANAVTIDDYATDVRSWVAVLRARSGADCVWILGHSEGGLVALAAGQNAQHLCGLILVSTAGRPIGEVLRSQLRSNPANAPLLDQAFSALDTLESGHRVDPATLAPALLPLFRPAVQGFLISELSLDPAKLIATVREPVLIVQGRRDIQVGVSDAERLKRSNPSARVALLADTNHVLKQVFSDQRSENIATYGNPDLPLAPGVVDSIADFVTRAGSIRQGQPER